MLEQMKLDLIQDIIDTVIDAKTTGSTIDRQRMLKNARLFARAHGAGYWVEAATMHDSHTPLEWIPIQWHEDSDSAITHVAKLHEESTSNTYHRVAGEHRTVQIFNQYSRGNTR